MRKIRIIFFISVFALLTGCARSNDKNYVKDIYIFKSENGYDLSVVYYDFTSGDENYLKTEYSHSDIFKLGIKAMEDKAYNFRLCENIFISPQIFAEEIDRAVYLINSLKISPSANIFCYSGNKETQTEITNPLYSISISNGKTTAGFPVIDENGNYNGNILIKNSTPVKITDTKTRLVISWLTNTQKQGNYIFRDGEMWASLDNRCTHFSTDENLLKITMDFTLKEYKGMHNSLQRKDLFLKLLKADITNTVYDIYKDTQLCEQYNLHWYCIQKGRVCENVQVKVNIK